MNRHLQGRVREARGHRYAGGSQSADVALGRENRERHWVVAVVGVIAAAASAYAAYSASEAQSASLSYQKKVAKNQAEAARQAGMVAEENEREENRRILASQRAAIGQSGVMGDVGSPLLAQIESAGQAELNARRTRYAYETNAKGFESEAILRGFESRSTRRAGYVQAGSSLLSGLSTTYASYKKTQEGKKPGGPNPGGSGGR
jgi:hypothetical protein